MVEPYQRFKEARSRVKQRGDTWLLTFDQWWSVWEESGMYERRGRGYVMALIDPDGPYRIDNVEIIDEGEAFRRTMNLHYADRAY
jgi:hypothetical protein